MATPVEAPKLGNTVEECLVTKWIKGNGDSVSAGDVVVEIETDKATFDVAAPVSGTVLETFFPEGALVPVFTNLFVIGHPGESVEAFRPQAAQAGSGRTAAGEAVASTTAQAIELALPGIPEAFPSTTAPAPAFSPRAKRFAEVHNFHPAVVHGSGPGGRVLEEDLRRLYDSLPKPAPEATETAQKGAEAGGDGSGAGGPALLSTIGPQATRISSVREKIGRRMRESLSTTAQYTLNASADAGGLLALRARIKASKGVPDININDLVAFCTIQALLQMPDLNVEFIDGEIHKHAEIHIGFACDTPRGLMVPVIRNAHKLGIAELALAAKDLSAQAFQGTISPDNLSGATFTISNLGSLGIESFTPLLNPPQVAILGVDAIQVKAVRRQGRVEFIDAIGLSLTCDHQVIDGAPGARFLQVLKEKIENVEALCTI